MARGNVQEGAPLIQGTTGVAWGMVINAAWLQSSSGITSLLISSSTLLSLLAGPSNEGAEPSVLVEQVETEFVRWEVISEQHKCGHPALSESNIAMPIDVTQNLPLKIDVDRFSPRRPDQKSNLDKNWLPANGVQASQQTCGPPPQT